MGGRGAVTVRVKFDDGTGCYVVVHEDQTVADALPHIAQAYCQASGNSGQQVRVDGLCDGDGIQVPNDMRVGAALHPHVLVFASTTPPLTTDLLLDLRRHLASLHDLQPLAQERAFESVEAELWQCLKSSVGTLQRLCHKQPQPALAALLQLWQEVQSLLPHLLAPSPPSSVPASKAAASPEAMRLNSQHSDESQPSSRSPLQPQPSMATLHEGASERIVLGQGVGDSDNSQFDQSEHADVVRVTPLGPVHECSLLPAVQSEPAPTSPHPPSPRGDKVAEAVVGDDGAGEGGGRDVADEAGNGQWSECEPGVEASIAGSSERGGSDEGSGGEGEEGGNENDERDLNEPKATSPNPFAVQVHWRTHQRKGVGVRQSQSGKIVISLLLPKSPLRQCGVREGDVVSKVNGNTVSDVHSFHAALEQCASGCVLEVSRDGGGECLQSPPTSRSKRKFDSSSGSGSEESDATPDSHNKRPKMASDQREGQEAAFERLSAPPAPGEVIELSSSESSDQILNRRWRESLRKRRRKQRTRRKQS